MSRRRSSRTKRTTHTTHTTPKNTNKNTKTTKNKLSAYEVARLKQIQENNEYLSSLKLNETRNAINSTHQNTRKRKPTTLGVKRKKKPRGPPAPARRSLRAQGKTPDGGKLPDDFKVLPQNGGRTSRVHERYEMDQKLKGDFDIVSGDGKDFLKQLLAKESSSSSSSTSTSKSSSSNKVSDVAKILSNLSVNEDHGVRKVTPERIYSLALMPSSHDIVVVAGDKKGNVGIWNVGSSNVEDGVFSTRPHSGTISHLTFSKINTSKLLTSSYDGSIKELDANKGIFREILTLEDRCLYEFDSLPDMSATYVADDEGDVHQIDLRMNAKNRDISSWTAHQKKINTLRVHPTKPWLIATASLDRSVSLWDVRRISSSGSSSSSSSLVPIYHLPHELSVSCAVFSTDGTKMLSNGCGPNHVKIYDMTTMMGAYEGSAYEWGSKMKKSMPNVQPKEKMYHDNRTGRWLTKFKPSFDPKRNDVFVMGCMDQPRCIEVFQLPSSSRETGVQPIMRLRDDLVNSVQSLNEFHVSKELIASANSSGRVSIWSC